MKIINQIITYFVGGLFIFSGAIKLNDPVGTQIKLEEYFEVFANDFAEIFRDFMPIALPLSVFLCVAEIVLGVSLLTNFKRRTTIHLLFGLIIFFTFLTFYSAYFDKVTDCGCFGDAIKLTPWESFGKDILLTILIGILMFQQSSFDNVFHKPAGMLVIGFFIASVLAAVYAIQHLPFVDFRNYKVGNNIPELMKRPKVPCKMIYEMSKDGEKFVFEEYPKDKSLKLDTSYIANESECLAKIQDYSFWSDTSDYTKESLIGKKLLILIQKTDSDDSEIYKQINELTKQTQELNIENVLITSVDSKTFEAFRHEQQLAMPYYFADSKLIKTIMRSRVGLTFLKDGQIMGKWHYNDIPSIEKLKELQ